MVTLTIATTTDFSATALAHINKLAFTNLLFPATATFAFSQFGGSISNAVAIDGSTAVNRIIVNGGSVNASAWTFANWGVADTLTFNGTVAAETFFGSSQADTINAGAGADTLRGGLGVDALNGQAGNDTFTYTAAEATGSETVIGGTEIDTLQLQGSGIFQFQSFTFVRLEQLQMTSAGSAVAQLDGTQIGNGVGKITSVTGAAGADKLDISGTAIDLLV